MAAHRRLTGTPEREPDTPGLEALARLSGTDAEALRKDPRLVLPALSVAGSEVLDVALGLVADDPGVRERAEVRRTEMLEVLRAGRRPPTRTLRETLVAALDAATQALRDHPEAPRREGH